MKDYDAILGLDWLEEPYALVDCRGKKIGRVEELLVAEELCNDHKKHIFFPFSSAATYTNCPLEIDQSDYEVQEEDQVEDGNASE
ncbi:hypothetical protein Taro_037742 [Colocasia esculenta]|uniref:Uncharacterized protein n=1 Tax=Colocasia esculenta TaxID=4460 RepID=A0A843WDR1_COLES|nr:hypothetical protein [Colocasia esculenta]